MWTRTLRAVLLAIALGFVAPIAFAQPAGGDARAVPLSVAGSQSRERVPPLVWVLVLGATLVGLRFLRSNN